MRHPFSLRVGRRRALATLGVLGAASVTARAAASLDPLTRLLETVSPPEAPPAFSVQAADGAERTLADYRGQGIVLNFWATWCIPCVAEMPALDRFAARAAKFAIAVLPVSIDTGGLAVVKPFYAAHHLTHLPILLDTEGAAAHAFKVPGIPSSFIIDRAARVVGHVLGAVQWDAPAAIDAIKRMVGPREESG